MDNYKFILLQFAIFFKNKVQERPDKLSVNINDRAGGVFDALPIILPSPEGAPIEFPFVQLTSTNQHFACMVSRSRLDFIYTPMEEDLALDYPEQKNKLKEIPNNLFKYASEIAPVNRIGLVTKFFVVDEKPEETFSDKFLKPRVGQIYEGGLRYGVKSETTDLKLNMISQLSIGDIDTAQKQRGISVQYDINTIKEVDYNFNEELLGKFMGFVDKSTGFGAVKKLFE